MKLDEYGMYVPRVKNNVLSDESMDPEFTKICPFSDGGMNEDALAESLFGKNCSRDTRVGFSSQLYLGYVVEQPFREIGTSGGMITWLLCELLSTKIVDGVIHVKQRFENSSGPIFEYAVSRSPQEVKKGAKSRYYPIEASKVLDEIKSKPGNYVFVGLPCFVKAVRRLADVDPQVSKSIRFYIGLVCGHLKSTAFAECFAWQADIPPDKLKNIDFRVKLSDRPANHYGVRLQTAQEQFVRPVRDFMGCNWGHNLFRYPACDFCDDVFAETADIAVGDAWLPGYEQDPLGNSLVVVRNFELAEIVSQAIREGRLNLSEASCEQVASSQAGGLRDRREGLAYRLWIRQKAGVWAPKKRVTPSAKGISLKRRKLYKLRSDIGLKSHHVWLKAKKSNSLDVFVSFYRAIEKKYIANYFTVAQKINYHIQQSFKFLFSIFLR